MNPKNKLAEMPVRPLLYTMAVPLMLSLLIQSLYNIVDSIFVARLSETALTAASLVYAIQFLMIAIGVGTAVGLNALLSRKLGQKKPEEACRAATTGLFLMLGTSLVFTLVGLLFSNQIAVTVRAVRYTFPHIHAALEGLLGTSASDTSIAVSGTQVLTVQCADETRYYRDGQQVERFILKKEDGTQTYVYESEDVVTQEQGVFEKG